MTNPQTTLYDRLGGDGGIADLTDRLYAKVLADPELAPIFARAPVEHIRAMQRQFIATALGGPVAYAGRDLRRAHAGKGISARHFYLFARKLFDALADKGISRDDAFEVVDRLAVHANDITGDPIFTG
jgi:hemoglobin